VVILFLNNKIFYNDTTLSIKHAYSQQWMKFNIWFLRMKKIQEESTLCVRKFFDELFLTAVKTSYLYHANTKKINGIINVFVVGVDVPKISFEYELSFQYSKNILTFYISAIFRILK
jgi:hypothetical protein